MLMPRVPNRYMPSGTSATADQSNSHGTHASSASRWKPKMTAAMRGWNRRAVSRLRNWSRHSRRSSLVGSTGIDNSAAVHRHRPRGFLVEDEVEYQRLDVAVEDQPDHLRVLVDHRRAGVTPDDVRGADEVERRLQVQLVLLVHPPLGQLERPL